MQAGRPLDVNSPDQPLDGETNFVSRDGFNVLESAMEEFKDLQNPRLTLEASFYGQQAYDAGSPRKNFFGFVLKKYSKSSLKMDCANSWLRNMSLLELLWP